jgi:hypothetical protein
VLFTRAQVMHPIPCVHTMQIAHSITDLQRVGRRFATVCGRLGIVSVAERTDLHSDRTSFGVEIAQKGHAAKETRTCLSLSELSLLWSAPHSIVTQFTHKIPASRRSSAAATHTPTKRILFLILQDSQAFPRHAHLESTTNKTNKAINNTLQAISQG